MQYNDWLLFTKQFIGCASPIVDFNPASDRAFVLNLTANNTDLTPELLADTVAFEHYIQTLLTTHHAKFAVGGYDEHRTVYSRSAVFDSVSTSSPRRLHLGVDIWGAVGTTVYAPLQGVVQSVQFNDAFGDYGATLILEHTVPQGKFYSLYGHLSKADLHLQPLQPIAQGAILAHFGPPAENGHWPPHLHFQIILDMGDYSGDYPGVCAVEEKENWLRNSPNPAFLLPQFHHLLGDGI